MIPSDEPDVLLEEHYFYSFESAQFHLSQDDPQFSIIGIYRPWDYDITMCLKEELVELELRYEMIVDDKKKAKYIELSKDLVNVIGLASMRFLWEKLNINVSPLRFQNLLVSIKEVYASITFRIIESDKYAECEFKYTYIDLFIYVFICIN
ncbi:unnamed protein product [Protopolystoma xenopodis]|uniref:Uncharacterized protein n=1 Tax=Protopolystoma xenopodis TaxID=117903 RepID=A0A448WCC3_9PLAT|nr:unnamed protein product [Protopolystoma xenopodis]